MTPVTVWLLQIGLNIGSSELTEKKFHTKTFKQETKCSRRYEALEHIHDDMDITRAW
jgi:hypothetical protein